MDNVGGEGGEVAKRFEEQLLQDVLEVVDKLKPANYKDSPQKIIAGSSLLLILSIFCALTSRLLSLQTPFSNSRCGST
jgi:hypothetical protein